MVRRLNFVLVLNVKIKIYQLQLWLLPLAVFLTFVAVLRDGSGIALFPAVLYIAVAFQVIGSVLVILFGGGIVFGSIERTAFFLLLMMFVFSVCSAIFSADFIALILQRSFSVFVPALLLMLAVFSVSNKRTLLINTSFVWVGFVFLMSALAIFLRFFGEQSYGDFGGVQSFSFGGLVFEQRVMGVEPFIRVSSMAGNPNLLSIWVFIAFPFLMYLKDTGEIGRSVFLFVFFVLFFTLVLTFSRGGFLGFFVSISLYFILKGKNIVPRVLTVLGVFVLLSLAFFWFGSSDVSSASRLDSGLSSRDTAWALILNEVYENPIVGIGFGVSGDKILDGVLDIGAHSFYLSILAELGIVGLCMYFLLVFVAVFSFFKAKKSKDVFLLEKTLAISVVGGLCLQQFFEGQLFRLDMVGYLWFYMFAIVVSQSFSAKKNS
ncbi:O-antigen ligase family protein [Kerstersia gyiorum]|uniref:O-antigen ligase family protein n=1 Tax=Kerstersia gyiorum TaxID=206506 RepID=UPI003B43B05A